MTTTIAYDWFVLDGPYLVIHFLPILYVCLGVVACLACLYLRERRKRRKEAKQ